MYADTITEIDLQENYLHKTLNETKKWSFEINRSIKAKQNEGNILLLGASFLHFPIQKNMNFFQKHTQTLEIYFSVSENIRVKS